MKTNERLWQLQEQCNRIKARATQDRERLQKTIEDRFLKTETENNSRFHDINR